MLAPAPGDSDIAAPVDTNGKILKTVVHAEPGSLSHIATGLPRCIMVIIHRDSGGNKQQERSYGQQKELCQQEITTTQKIRENI